MGIVLVRAPDEVLFGIVYCPLLPNSALLCNPFLEGKVYIARNSRQLRTRASDWAPTAKCKLLEELLCSSQAVAHAQQRA